MDKKTTPADKKMMPMISMDKKTAKFFASFMMTAFLIGSAFVAAGIIR